VNAQRSVDIPVRKTVRKSERDFPVPRMADWEFQGHLTYFFGNSPEFPKKLGISKGAIDPGR
jgi:hypothetical protein